MLAGTTTEIKSKQTEHNKQSSRMVVPEAVEWSQLSLNCKCNSDDRIALATKPQSNGTIDNNRGTCIDVELGNHNHESCKLQIKTIEEEGIMTEHMPLS